MDKYTYTFNGKKDNNKATIAALNILNGSFNSAKHTDYSKTLDDIIAANIIKSNPYLKKYTAKTTPCYNYCTKCPFNTGSLLKGEDKLTKAINFFLGYKELSAKAPADLPFKLNTLYKLGDTSIIFYDDEFQIGCDTYKYDDFGSLDFIKSLAPAKKDIIIKIFGASNITININ